MSDKLNKAQQKAEQITLSQIETFIIETVSDLKDELGFMAALEYADIAHQVYTKAIQWYTQKAILKATEALLSTTLNSACRELITFMSTLSHKILCEIFDEGCDNNNNNNNTEVASFYEQLCRGDELSN
jgi:ketopantoate reductase